MQRNKLHRVYIFFHAWEFVALLLIAGWLVPAIGTVLIPLAFGMAVHLLLDAWKNPTSIANYSLAVRRAYGFSSEKFYVMDK
jgi:hypothetical protein